jgi:HK97 family phage portal protein
MGIKQWVIKQLGGEYSQPKKILTGSELRLGLPNWSNYRDTTNIERFITLDDIYSIVSMIAKTAATIPLMVYEVKDEKALKAYAYASKQQNHTPAQLIQKQFLKTKALVEVKEDNQLQFLLDNPNGLYAKSEFYEGVYGFKLITGNQYIWAPKFEFGLDKGKPMEMWILPSQFTNPVIVQTFPHSISEYEFTLYGIAKIPANEMLHGRYFNPYFTINGDELIGLSPMQVLHRTLDMNQSEANYKKMGYENAGAVGIVNFEDLDQSEATNLGAMKSDFYRESTGPNNARKSLFHAGKTTFTQIGLSPVDMQVVESGKVTFKKLCNAYRISDRLFNNDATGSEISTTLMVKQLYTNAALPEVYALRDLINKNITPLYNIDGKKYFVDCDITGINELQEDMKKMADIYSQLPVMQPNMILEAFNYGKSDNPNMDKYYIKPGYVPIDDLNISDLPLTNDYDNNGTAE